MLLRVYPLFRHLLLLGSLSLAAGVAHAATYTLPGSLPPGCTGSGTSYTCSTLSLNWNDNIVVSNANTTLTVTGTFTPNGNAINFTSPASGFTLAAGTVNGGQYFNLNGNLTASGTITATSGTNQITGNVTGTTLNIGGSIGGNVTASGSLTTPWQTSIGGNVNATSVSSGGKLVVGGSLTASSGGYSGGSSDAITGSVTAAGAVTTAWATTIGGNISGSSFTSGGGSTYGGSVTATSGNIQSGSADSFGGNITSNNGSVTINSSGGSVAGNISAKNDVDLKSGTIVQGSVTSTSGSVTLRSSSTSVSGSVSAGGTVYLESGTRVRGNATSSGDKVTLESSAQVDGDISAQKDITLGSNARAQGNVTSVNQDIVLQSSSAVIGQCASVTKGHKITLGWSANVHGVCCKASGGSCDTDTSCVTNNSGGSVPPICAAIPTLSIANASVSEGNNDITNLIFTVTLSTASSSTVTIKYSTADGTASGSGSCSVGTDYIKATNNTLSIPAGQLTGTFTIQICGDTTIEPDETFTVTLSSPTNATLGSPSTATGTIINDDTSAPASFNAVDTGANGVSGKIGTKVVGSGFTVDVVALNSGKTAVDTSINQQVKVELIANATATTVGSNNCPSGGTAISVGTYTLTDGKAAVSVAAVSSAYRDVRVRISYPATGTATVTACSADNFAIRPGLLNLAVKDADWATAGTSRDLNNTTASGGVVHKAGRPFTVSSTAYASNGSTQVSNYDGGATLVTTGCAIPPTDVCPASLGSLTPTSLTFASGSASNSGVSYSEAGSFTLQLQDTTFAAVDANDGTPTQCQGPGYDINQTPGLYACSQSTDVGRFVPDHYAVTSIQAPKLQTFGGSCASRSFTYLGQPFGFATASLPIVTITAQNFSNGTTANYKANLWKLVASNVSATDLTLVSCKRISPPQTAISCPSAATVTPSTFSNTNSNTNPSSEMQINGNGTATFTWPTNAGLIYKLDRSSTALEPFTPTIDLGITIADNSETGCGPTPSTPCTLIDNQVSSKTWSSVAFDSGAEFRHGRLKIGNAYGATSLDLAIPLEVQYYSAGSFVTNTADNCTTLTAGNIGLRNAQKNLGLAEIDSDHVKFPANSTPPYTPPRFAAGQLKLRLVKPTPAAAPNDKVDGSIDVFAYLGSDANCAVSGASVASIAPSAASPALTHLQDSWPWEGTTCANPVGRATFGLERQKFLYMREQY